MIWSLALPMVSASPYQLTIHKEMIIMKQIPLKTQRIIMFIPYLNILNLPFWLFNSINLDLPYRGVPQTFFIMLKCGLPLVLLQLLLYKIYAPAGNILGYINAYLAPLLIGHALIKLQEKLGVNEY